MKTLIACFVCLCGSGRTAGADDVFDRRVKPLLARYCVSCHGPDLAEGKLTLHKIDPDLLSGPDFETWRIIDERLQFREMPPKEADQPKPEERKRLLAWIRSQLRKTQQPGKATRKKLLLPQFGNYVDHQALFGPRQTHVTPAPPRIWRLRPDIYKSLSARLGDKIKGLANALNLADGSEIKDYAASYFLDEASALQLFANAKKIASAQLSAKSKDRIFRQLAADKAPSEKLVIAAIETAFRNALGRGPTEDERTRFLGLHRKSAKIGGPRNAGLALLTAVLMKPEFVFRQELGAGKPDQHGRIRLSQREIAYALSYALSDRPIDEFTRAAAAGKLATRQQITKLVRERLRDDSPLHDRNSRLLQFFREYFHYPFANEVFKDQPAGGEHNPGSLVADLELTISEILKRDRNVLSELLTTKKYFVNVKYGRKKEAGKLVIRNAKTRKYQTSFSLPLDWKWSVHLQPVEMPRNERAGVLTHPAWLSAWSGNFENHPVQRGKWIRTNLLGGTVPDVPIGVDARVPEADHKTFRDRLKMATNKAECWRCHKKMDPLGVVFERFDHYGRYQRRDAGQPVDARGVIDRTGVASLDGNRVTGPVELMQLLAKSEYVEQVFVRHVFRFVMGRNETLGDANTLQDAHSAYRKNNGSYKELLISLLSSDSFLLRQKTK